MAATTLRILDEVSQVGIELLLREPFYAHLLSSLNKAVVGPGHPVDTLAIGMGHHSLTLYINAGFWDDVLRQPQHRYGVLKHELLHLVFRHPFVDEPTLDVTLLNIAFDLVVNQYIERALLPEESLFLDTFPQLQLEPGQTWYYYYKKLEAWQSPAEGDVRQDRGSDLPQNIRSDTYGLERHRAWRDIRGCGELERAVVETHLKSLLQMACRRTGDRAWGALPGTLREALGALQVHPPAHLPWRQVIRLFAGSAMQTRLKNTLRRPSKRYGTTPGLQIRRRCRLWVAVDTSGSIDQEELRLFFGEIYHIWRAGAAVEILETDTRVQRRYSYRGLSPQSVSGRGGTDFNDVLQLANAERPDALVFFTDGYAEEPNVLPRLPVLWVIPPGGADVGSPLWQGLPGRKVKMHM